MTPYQGQKHAKKKKKNSTSPRQKKEVPDGNKASDFPILKGESGEKAIVFETMKWNRGNAYVFKLSFKSKRKRNKFSST